MPQGRAGLSGPVSGGNSASEKRLDRPGKCGSGSSRAGCSRISCAQPQELPPAAVFHALRRRVQSLFHNQVIEIQCNSAIGAFFASPGASALQCALREVVAVGCTELSTGRVDNEILSFTTATWRRFVSPDATMRGNYPKARVSGAGSPNPTQAMPPFACVPHGQPPVPCGQRRGIRAALDCHGAMLT